MLCQGTICVGDIVHNITMNLLLLVATLQLSHLRLLGNVIYICICIYVICKQNVYLSITTLYTKLEAALVIYILLMKIIWYVHGTSS